MLAKIAKKKAAAASKIIVAETGNAAERRLSELLELIARREGQIVENFFDIGTALLEIEKKKLYAVRGYKSFVLLLEAEDLFGRTTAGKLMTVARSYRREQIIGLTFEKAYALARYVASSGKETVADLLEHRSA